MPIKLLIALLWSAVALPAATPSTLFKFDHFGWRPTDAKRVLLSVDPGASLQVREAGSNAVVFSVPADGGSISALGFDVHAGESVWAVDFSAFNLPGSYFFYANALSFTPRSYDFDIDARVYNAAGVAALKAYFYQRCGSPKPVANGGVWADAAACHSGDASVSNAAGHVNRGAKDLSGGWHDAGDYNKYAWYAAADSVFQILQAWEDNRAVFNDGESDIPESGNGFDDVLDEMQIEADWLLKMQLPDGSFLDRVKAADGVFTWNSPPSADTTLRYYRDPTAESCGIGTGTLARAAYAFALDGQAAKAAQYKAAALAGWGFLATTTTTHASRAWAAAEIVYLDGVATTTSARAYVDSLSLGTQYYDPDSWITWAASTYVQSAAASAGQVISIRNRIGNRVNGIMSTASNPYGQGMETWQYYWGSNRPRAKYGLLLLQAAKIGGTAMGSYSAAQLKAKAQDYLHYFHGLNPLNFVYLTNMSTFGGEHSCYQLYHGWFGSWSNTFSRNAFIGKAPAISESAYPYYAGTDSNGVNDNKSSTYGPAPGILPGGVNASYSGSATPPSGAAYRDLAFRDIGDMSTFSAVVWELTENSISSQGPYVALAAYFMGSAVAPTATPTPTPSPSATPTPTPCAACSPTTTPTPPPTAAATTTPTGGLPRLYPNPVYLDDPDPATHVLRFDSVEAGSTAEIFNLTGERVINLNLSGDPRRDAWDCVNANGAGVATGVYLILIKQPKAGNSVQRAAIIRTR